jgi:glycosyltransferase involved in cell wall biosynthesis
MYKFEVRKSFEMIKNTVFKVSVIIPVYNAEKFILRAVESVIHLHEVGEVILIEDCSPDGSLELCQSIALKYQKLKLIINKTGKNYGAGGARNIGIKNALFGYVSFLDADDIYLPNRFKKEKNIFDELPYADAVYGFTTAKFENEIVKDKYLSRHEKDDTFEVVVEPGELLSALLLGSVGRFHTNAITLKKDAFKKSGLFDPELKLSQDSELWIRLAATCNLYPGELQSPIAIRQVHTENRVHANDDVIKLFSDLMYTKLFSWAMKQSGFSFAKRNYFFIAYYQFVDKQRHKSLHVLLHLLKLTPSMFFTTFFYRKLYQIFKASTSKATVFKLL